MDTADGAIYQAWLSFAAIGLADGDLRARIVCPADLLSLPDTGIAAVLSYWHAKLKWKVEHLPRRYPRELPRQPNLPVLLRAHRQGSKQRARRRYVPVQHAPLPMPKN